MSDTRDNHQLEVPSDRRLRGIVNNHPIAALVSAFVIGLLLARFTF